MNFRAQLATFTQQLYIHILKNGLTNSHTHTHRYTHLHQLHLQSLAFLSIVSHTTQYTLCSSEKKSRTKHGLLSNTEWQI